MGKMRSSQSLEQKKPLGEECPHYATNYIITTNTYRITTNTYIITTSTYIVIA